MRLITDLLAEADAANNADGNAFMTANRYKKHREAWVLGYFSALYNGWDKRPADLVFAEPGDNDEVPTDFAVFDGTGTAIAHIEISEAMDPDRRRGDECADPNRQKAELIPDPEVVGGDPWRHLAEVIGKKVTKGGSRYVHPTWLVIYVNVFASLYGDDLDCVLAAEQALDGLDLEATAIAEIWLLDGTKAAHRVFPDRRTISLHRD